MRSELLLLRQLGGVGVWLLASQIVEGSGPDWGIVALLEQALSGEEACEALVARMVLDHSRLDAAELAKDKRGGISAASMQVGGAEWGRCCGGMSASWGGVAPPISALFDGLHQARLRACLWSCVSRALRRGTPPCREHRSSRRCCRWSSAH